MMDPQDWILPRVQKMVGYVPGAQPERPDIVKLNTNENPFPASRKVIDAIKHELESDLLQRYPNPRAEPLRKGLAGRLGRSPECYLAGNGSDEILAIVFRALLEPGRSVVFPDPSYGLYPTLAAVTGAGPIEVPVHDDWSLDFAELKRAGARAGAPLTVITNPNAPTGRSESQGAILEFARANAGLTLVDEAYVEFGGESVEAFAGTEEFPRLLTCNTMSKAYSLAGARLGWLVAHPELVRHFDKVRDSYNLSRLAQAAGLAALSDTAELKSRVAEVIRVREDLIRSLAELGFTTIPSQANFVFTKAPSAGGHAAADLFLELESQGIIVRHFDRPRLRDFIRITIGTPEQMARLLSAIRGIVGS